MAQSNGFVRAASILAVGNIASRMLGLVRDTVITHYFGAHLASAYETAVLIPNNLFDAVKTGMVDSALVPVFSDLSQEKDRKVLWEVVSAFLSVTVVVLIAGVLLIELFHRPIARSIGAYEFSDPALTETTISLMRLAMPAVLFLSIASILTALLYALKKFTIPAFIPAVFNGTIVIMALLRPSHVSTLVYGLLIGALLQIIMQLPALREAQIGWSWRWRHPAIGRILQLFTPIIGVLLVDQVVRIISYHLANTTGDGSLNYMRRATTLYQFPMGLVVTALTIAILPILSAQANQHIDLFRGTLSNGLRTVLVLILPATFGLLAIALPVVDLLFGHGEYTPFDVQRTATVLQFYLIGMPFAAVDQMLIFGSYARKNTLTPSIVGVISMIISAFVAVSWVGSWGLYSLMLADAAKHIVHTVLMLFFLRQQIGRKEGAAILHLLVRALLASMVMGGIVALIGRTLRQQLPHTNLNEVITVTIAAVAGIIVYGLFVYLFNMQEVRQLLNLRRHNKATT